MKKFKALFVMQLQHFSEYRGDVLVYTFSSIVLPVIMLNVWLSVAHAKGADLHEISYLVQYYFFQIIINIFISSWQGTHLADTIRKGEISPHLLRPYPHIYLYITENIGEKFWKVLFSFLALVPLAFFYRDYLAIPLLQTLPQAVLVIILAAMIRFLISHVIGLAGFFVTDISAIRDIHQMLLMLMSGVLFPLKYATKVIPAEVILLFPYAYIIGFPVDVLIGRATGSALFTGIAWQIFWFVVLYSTYRIMWYKGLKRYGGYGA